MIKKVFILFITFSSCLFSQYSTNHYMPPLFYGQNSSDAPDEIRIDLSTMEEGSSFNVLMKNSAGSTLYTKSISKGSPNNFSVSTNYLYANDYGTNDSNKGLYFEASKPFYMRVDIRAGSQTGSISSKGQQGMGTEFRSAHFYQSNISYNAKNTFGSFISMMGTEDNTTITITPNSGVYFLGRSNTLPWSVSVDKGESYVVGINNTISSYDEDVIGTLISSNKNIVVNSGTWSGSINTSSGAKRDMGVDQLVPVDVVGNDYLIIEGESGTHKGVNAIIVATENNTVVTVDGTVRDADLDAGEFYAWSLDNNNNNSLDHINTSKPSLVYYQGYSTDQNDIKNNHGLFILAPLNTSSTASGYNHAHFGDNLDDILGQSGEANFYVLKTGNTGSFVYNNNSQSSSNWDNQSIKNYTVNGTTWELYRKLDWNIGDNDFYISNAGPLYVWFGMGAGERGFFSSIQNFVSSNNAPVANAQTINSNEDTDQTITLSGSDSDNDNLSYIITSLPSNGTLYQTSDGSTRGNAISSTGTTITDSNNRLIFVPDLNENGSNYGNFNFKVNDGTSDSDVASITLNVLAVNDPPVVGNSNVSTNEDTEIAFSISNLNYSDTEGSSISGIRILGFSLNNSHQGTLYLDANNNDSFDNGEQISTNQVVTASNISNGHLRFYPNTNDNDASTHFASITFEANDGSNYSSSSGNVYIYVQPVDDAPNVANQINNITVSEDASNSIIDLSNVFNDVDNNNSDITKSVTANDGSSNVTASISGNNLTLDFLDNKHGSANITITGTSNGLTVSETFSVTINPVNDAPTDIGLSSTSIADDSNSGTVVGSLTSTDVDQGDSHNYSIIGGADASKFTIDNSNLVTNATIDYHVQQNYVIVIRTTDSAGATYDETITINASNPNNQRPVVTSSQSFNVNENQSSGTVVGTVQGSDADGETLQNWTIESGVNKNHFSINSTSGEIVTSKILNYEDANERNYTLGLKVSDGNEFSSVVNITINVNPINDLSPIVGSDQSFQINENIDIGTTVGTVNATDPDVWPTGTTTTFQNWEIVSGNTDGHFLINSSTGVITSASLLDYETNSSYTLIVRVSDGNNTSNQSSVVISLNDINESPLATNLSETTNEETVKTLTLQGSDPEGNSLSYVITDLPKNGVLFQMDETLINSANTTVSSNTDQIKYSPNINFVGNDTLFFKVNDGTNDSQNALFVITVNNVNDSPVAIRDTISILEDNAAIITLNGTDIDNNNLDYSISLKINIGDLYQSNDGINKTTLINSGDNVINSQNKIYFEPQSNAFGTDSLTFSVTDGELIDSEKIIVIISPVADNPIAEDGEIVIAQGLEWDYDLSNKISDPDYDLNLSSLSILSSGGGGQYRVPSDTTSILVFDYTNNLNYTGTDSVIYQICDNTNLCDSGKIKISITEGRKPIAISDTLIVDEDAEPRSFNVLRNDSDLDNNLDISSLEIISAFKGSFDDSENQSQANPDSTILISMASNFYGNDSLTYRISDDTRLSSEAKVYILVNAAPDPPEVVDPITVFIEEGEPLNDLFLNATDADGDTLIYTLCQEASNSILTQFSDTDTLKNGDILLVSSIESPKINITPEKGFYGDDIFRYCVEDQDGNIAEARVIISVVNVPEFPIANNDSIEVFQNSIGRVNVLLNDTDPENDIDYSTLLIFKDKNSNQSFKTTPTNKGGIATVQDSSIKFDYSNLLMFTGIDSIYYSICDSEKLCDTSSVYINVYQDDIPPGVYNISTNKDTLLLENTLARLSSSKEITIKATIKDSLPLESVILKVGKGGSNEYLSYPIDFENGIRMLETEETITIENLDERGIKFYYFASDILGYASDSQISSIPIKTSNGLIKFPDCIPPNEWILISIPTDLEENRINDVFYNSFGYIDKEKFLIWEFENGNYTEPSTIEPGLSYWIYQKVGEECDLTLGSGVITQIDTLEWELKPGWNLVGNPYPFSFNMGEIDHTLYCGPLEFSSNSGWSDHQDTISPFGGYIICNKTDSTIVFKSSGDSNLNLSKTFFSNNKNNKENNFFRGKISFKSSKFSDNNNFFGYNPNASESFDEYDNITEPPLPNNENAFKFDWILKDINGFNKYLLEDIKNGADSTFIWDGILKTSKNQSDLKLTVSNLENIHQNKKLILVDRSNGETFDLLSKKTFTIKKGHAKNLGRKFSLIHGPEKWVKDQVDEIIQSIPSEFNLSQNYPNPFNPITTINYQIPLDQKVMLKVYNLIGQEIITLVNKEQYAGNYSIIWNGKDKHNKQVSSGTYFYVLKTENHSISKKMLLLK